MAQPPPCPYCGASAYKVVDARWLACKECGQEFDVRRDLCSSCGFLNVAEATICGNCQTPLRRDPVDRMFETLSRSRAQWHERRLGTDLVRKRQDVAASEERMAALLAQERERKETIALALAESQRRERRALLIVAIVGTMVLVALVAATLVLILG